MFNFLRKTYDDGGRQSAIGCLLRHPGDLDLKIPKIEKYNMTQNLQVVKQQEKYYDDIQ